MRNKEEIIKDLAKEFNQEPPMCEKINTSDFVEGTKALDCSLNAVSVDDMQKTLRVIKQHEKKFLKDVTRSEQAQQFVYHLRIAAKCVEEVMSQRNSQ